MVVSERVVTFALMKIKSIKIQNLKAVSQAEINAEGKHVFLIAGNNKGKTTIGRLLSDVMMGNRPSVPLTKGETNGFAEITLDDGMVIKWAFDENKDTLTVISKEGHKVSGAATLLKSLAGGMNFDVNAFLALQPKKQKEAMEKIIGVDFSEVNAKYEKAFTRRTAAKRDLTTAEARRTPYDLSLVTKAPIDSSALMQELFGLEEKNRAKAGKLQVVQAKAARISETESEIARLQALLFALKGEQTEALTAYNAVEAVDESTLTDLRTQISSASTINAAIEQAKLAHRFEQEYLFAQADVNDAQLAVENAQREKDSILESNPLPAQGLTFSDEGLLFNGLPFEDNQISTSSKMIAGAQIALSQMAEVKVLHFDISLLDKHNVEKITQWADSQGLQLFMERADWDGGDLEIRIQEAK